MKHLVRTPCPGDPDGGPSSDMFASARSCPVVSFRFAAIVTIVCRMKSTVLHRGHTIVTIEDVISRGACDELIARSERMGFQPAPITTSRGFVMAPEIRDNTRVMLDDRLLAASLWRRLAEADAVPKVRGRWHAIGLNERFRFYRYERGQRFRWHRDGAFVRSSTERSHLTLLLYLNDPPMLNAKSDEGGATQFDLGGVNLSVEPKAGRVLLFEHEVRHQGAPVIEGRKYVLRTDVMYIHGSAL